MREPEWKDAPRSGWVWSLVKILIGINLAVFLLLNVIIHYGSEPIQKFVGDFMILKAGAGKDIITTNGGTVRSGGQVYGLWDGAVWQLITYQFMHFSLWHVLMNMLGLYFIGKAIEELYGRSVLLKLYLLGGICGGLLETAFTWYGHSPDMGIAGASGSVFALLSALTWAMPDRRLTLLLFFVLPITLKARTIFWGLFAITAFCIVFPSRDGIAHGAHLGGFLLGWGFAHFVLLGGFSLGEWGPLARLSNKGSQRRKVVQVGASRAFSSSDNTIIDAEETTAEEFMEQEIDPILEKIYKEGIHSLTERERKILDEARNRMEH